MPQGLLGYTLPNPVPDNLTHWWQGQSGYWYIHSAFKIDAIPPLLAANYIFVKRTNAGLCEAIYVGEAADLRERLKQHEKLWLAMMLGANEIHVHLLAEYRSDRLAIETDLRNAHPTLLNFQ